MSHHVKFLFHVYYKITSDTDQSKQSLSPKFTYHHGESSELSCCEDCTSPTGQRVSKSYRKMRSASAPRAYVTETNIWREFSLPSYCVPDYRRTPAMYIEQDIINKQRQEIQLLMEELGNRDQELTDLVMSHQKQVKAWECDNEKNRTLQAKLAYCEDELKSKDDQLKKVLVELVSVNDQREVDVKELKRTQNEMIKLTERIMENSLYIKEMEAQNQKLNSSLRDFANIRQAFRVREQELISLLKEKDFRITDKQLELDKLAEYVKILESQCRELGERNNNMTEESINWRKKYCILKEETERLNDDCRKKEDNMQKMTQQLHESLQQAIALQKALFTSCEREKCKEEVMYSLRRQHKRTMQELQNIRELYDRLTRDASLYHLSINDKEFVGDGKRKEEVAYEEDVKRKRHMEHTDTWHHDSRRKVNVNMSFNKFKHLGDNEESFLLKESKERKTQPREGKHWGMSEEDSAENNTEEEGKIGAVSTSYNKVTDRAKVHATMDASQRMSPIGTPSRLKNGHDSSKVAFTNQTSCVVPDYIKMPAADFRNRSKNSESRIARSPCRSPLSDSSGISQKANPVSLQEVVGDVSPEMADVKEFKENGGVNDQALSSSHASRHDGMCCEVIADKPQKDTRHRDPPAQPHGSTACEPTPSRSTAVNRKDDLPKKDQEEQQFSTSDEPASVTRQPHKKKSVDFDMQDKVITSRPAQAESHCVCSESDCHVTQSHERNDASAARSNSACLNKRQPPRQQADGVCALSHERNDASATRSNSACLNKRQPSRQQADGVCDGYSSGSEERRKNSPLKTREDSLEESKASDKERSQRVGKLQQCEHEGQEEDCLTHLSENFVHNEVETNFTMTPAEKYEHHLKHETCDHCRARGKRVCDCSRSQRSCGTNCKQPTVTFAPDVSSSDKSYPTLKEPVTLTSKFSLADYFSSVRESENSHVQDFSKREFNEGPLTYPPMTEFKNPLSHQANKKIHFSLPLVDSFHNQNQHHKPVCEVLPEEVSAYLARQRCFRPEMYYNNNNKSDSHIHNPNMTADNSDFNQHFCNGQPLSRSVRSLSSSGQSARSVSNGKPKRNVVSNQEDSVFTQEAELQKEGQLVDERRGEVLEAGRKDVSGGHKRCDDNIHRSEDCRKGSCDTVRGFDACRRTVDCKRYDDAENKRANNKRFDDSQRRYDDSQRRSEDNKSRFDCDNRHDNSSNNSNRESTTVCSQSSCCDVRAAVASQETPIESKHRLSFLKKTHHAQEKRPEIRGEFQHEQTSQKTQNELGDSAGGSYFCPEESDVEKEGCADYQPRQLADGGKAPLVDGRTRGQVSVRPAHFKSGADLLLHKRTSQRCSDMPQLVQTVLPTRNGDCSGARNNKSGIIASLSQGKSNSRSCQFEGRSDVTKSSKHGESDSTSFALEARSSNPMSSKHRAIDRRSCELEGRSGVTKSLGLEGSNSTSFELEARSNNPMSSRHRSIDRRSCELEGRSGVTKSLGLEGSNSTSCELEGRSCVTKSSGLEESGSAFFELVDRPNNPMSSRHRSIDRRSCELEGRSTVVLSSTQKQLDSKSFEEYGRSGFTLYSTQERLDNELLPLDSRSDVTFADQEGPNTNTSEPKDRSGVTISSVHKQSNDGFCEQYHKTREENDDSKHNISTIISHVIVSHCDSSHLGNCGQNHVSSDHPHGKISVRSVR